MKWSQPIIWSIAEAKSKLSEILRRASDEGPQTIGRRKGYVVVPIEEWERLQPAHPARQTLGQWMVANAPRDGDLELPDRSSSGREVPILDEAGR